MNFVELFILAVGLSMDAFAVSICKGLAVKKVTVKEMALAGVWFGGFQALMPLIGYFLGCTCEKYITKIDHWIAFTLLVLIGLNMIREAVSKKEECTCQTSSFGFKTMFTMAVATSIDALAVGVTFGFLPNVNIWAAISFIGITTFVFSAAGVKIGSVFGSKYEKKAEIAGGVVLILIGTKILLEHLGVIHF